MNVKAAKSSYRDRTDEFFGVAERRRKSLSPANKAAPRASSNNTGSKPDDRRSAVVIQSEFNKKASKIGLGIHQTSQKLAKLAKCEANYW
ncbi:hypothetical protein SLEP1_g18420 [Rubroshorea leprosula]|uniref:Uncharacterized protein n=1 Tax=Rubroshorea leprosula TaxID=152421 RepID=A0AAV5J6C4_9ROSI|nr:hypothetical protein SLEP1_g18420 [Rubroshorea leprosula]